MSDSAKLSAKEKLLIQLQKPKLEQKVNFFRLMAITQNAGLWIRDSLYTLLQSEKHPWMKKILQHLLRGITKWNNVADSMKAHNYFFSNEEIELIRSSESIWNMPKVLQNIAEEAENLQSLRSKVKSALMYPIMIMLFAAVAVVVLLVKVIPTIVELFPSKEALPWITKFMLWASDYLQENWYVVIMVPVLIFFALRFSYKLIPQFKSICDLIFLKVPPFGDLIKKYNLYRFSKLMADFYMAWLSPNVSLFQIAWVLNNVHYKEKVLHIKKDIEVWLNFSEAMEWHWLFDPILIQIITVWETTWNLWEVLDKISKFYREDVDNKLWAMVKLIEPLLMAFIAVVIWTIVASIFLPMWDLLSQIWNN